MQNKNGNCFGSFAVRDHFVLPEQVEEALRMQGRFQQEGQPVPRLGGLLTCLGYMTPKQVQVVLEEQVQACHELFGQMAIEWKLCSKEQIETALAQQETARKTGQRVPRLGELLASSGALKPHQIRALLRGQGKEIVACPACHTRYNAKNLKAGAHFKCPRCKMLFAPLQPSPESSPKDDDVRVEHTLMLPPIRVLERLPAQTLPAMFIGPYQILQRLGSDHSGVLYKALHPQTGNSVALRLLSKQILEGAEEFERWKRAGQKATTLNHPNLQRILSMSTNGTQAYLVMEYVEGKSLRQCLAEKNRYPHREALEILVQTSAALVYGQAQHLIHGDIRPNHLLIGLDGRVRLSGLGTPKCVMKDLLLMCEISGSVPLYAAPEVLIDEAFSDERSDIYSLCAVGYHLFTGFPPLESRQAALKNLHVAQKHLVPPRQLAPHIPPYIERMLLKGLATDQHDRYQTLGDFLDDLRMSRAGLQTQAHEMPRVAPDLLPGVPKPLKRFSHTLAARRLHTHWLNTGKAGTERHAPVENAPPGSPGAPAEFPAHLETRQVQAIPFTVSPEEGRSGSYLVRAWEAGCRKFKPSHNRTAQLATLAMFLVSTAFILGFLYLIPEGKVSAKLERKNPEAPAAVSRPAVADPLKEDYFTLVEKPIKIDAEEPQAIVQSIDRYLGKHGAMKPEPALVKIARNLRDQYAKEHLEKSRVKLQEQIKKWLAQDQFSEALSQVKQWQDAGGQDFQNAGAEELAWIFSDEKQKAEAEFERVRGLAASKHTREAVRAYEAMAKRFNPEFAARAMEEQAKLQKAEKEAAAAAAAAKRAQESAEFEREETARQNRESALYESLLKIVREALGNLNLNAAHRALEKHGALLAGTRKEVALQQLREEAGLVEKLRDRILSAAQEGRLRDLWVSSMGGAYGIAGATPEGPILDVKGGRVTIRWPDLSVEERLAAAERVCEPTNGKHQMEWGNYLFQLGQPAPAERAFLAAQKLGEPAEPWLEKVREVHELSAERPEGEKSAKWDCSEYIPGSLSVQDPGMQKSLKSQGWTISRGYWTITSLGTLYGEWENPSLPLLSLKHELKRFSSISVEMRGAGAALGYSFGKGQRFLAKPNGRWQKLELQVTAGDLLKFTVDGQPAQSLENPGAPVSSEQLSNVLYLRCEGRQCEIRNFQVDGKDLSGAELPWEHLKQRHTPTVQSAKDQDLLKSLDWEITKGLWVITPSGGFLGAAQGDAAILQRDKPAAFRKLTVEFRGEGEAAGFSFGKGLRFLAKPAEKWQRLTLEVAVDGQLRMLVNGEVRPALDGLAGVKAIQLPKILYLRAQGGTVEFRGFSMETP